MVTAERVRELFNYDPETGLFTYKVSRRGSGRKIGDPVGCKHMHESGMGGNAKAAPLILIGIDYKLYRAHRLAWLHYYGEWPKNKIDHIDGNPLNNAINNLRDVDSRINSQNMRRAQPYNSTGLLGVTVDKDRSCFRGEIRLPNGKRKFLGRFKTPQEAHEAYLKAKRIYHEGCEI